MSHLDMESAVARSLVPQHRSLLGFLQCKLLPLALAYLLHAQQRGIAEPQPHHPRAGAASRREWNHHNATVWTVRCLQRIAVRHPRLRRCIETNVQLSEGQRDAPHAKQRVAEHSTIQDLHTVHFSN